MSKPQRNPRAACFEPNKGGNDALVITELGLAHVEQMAGLGAKPREIAQYLRVSHTWLEQMLDPEHERFCQAIADAFDEGSSDFKKRLLMAQAALSESNAQMAIHLGKQHLGQREDAHEVNHNIRIVGTLPDYASDSEQWRRQFAPTPLQTVEAPKPSRASVIDAEVIKE